MADNQLADELSLFETLTRPFAAALGLLYLMGFLVVASYLSRYGVSSFAVLQLQYLIAGIWALGPPVLYASLLHTEHRFRERAAPEVEGNFNWRRFAISSLGTGVPSALLIVLLAKIPGISENITAGMGVRLFLFFFAMIICSQLFWTSQRVDSNRETWWINRSHAAPFYLALLLMVVLCYVL